MPLPAPRYEHCLVTGASSGIGRTFARALAPRARVMTLTARRVERLEELAAELRASHGVTCRVLPMDLALPDAGMRLAERVRSYGVPVDLLVNNAGFGRHGGWDAYPWADWSAMFRLNMETPAALLHAFWDELRSVPGRGAINVASTAGFQPIPHFAAYAATKAFLRSLSLGLAGEARASGTRVMSLCPGPTGTEFGAAAKTDWQWSKVTMTAERVVEIALAAYAAGRTEIIPGTLNRVVAVVASRAPRALVLAGASRLARRRSKGRPGPADRP